TDSSRARLGTAIRREMRPVVGRKADGGLARRRLPLVVEGDVAGALLIVRLLSPNLRNLTMRTVSLVRFMISPLSRVLPPARLRAGSRRRRIPACASRS